MKPDLSAVASAALSYVRLSTAVMTGTRPDLGEHRKVAI
jgi:hypothetical protein